jgi:hypothetical protein
MSRRLRFNGRDDDTVRRKVHFQFCTITRLDDERFAFKVVDGSAYANRWRILSGGEWSQEEETEGKHCHEASHNDVTHVFLRKLAKE